MDAREAIKINLGLSEFISLGYLGDLSDQEFLHRPAPGANHITWQIGHLVSSEHQMMNQVFPGEMPALPEGFVGRYTKETVASDNASDFDSRETLIDSYRQQRGATLELLDRQSPEELDRATPESMQSYAPTVGAAFSMQGTHWVMHAGQWAVIRRQLGRPPLF